MNRLHRILLDPSGAEGGTPAPAGKEFDIDGAVQRLLAKHGNAERAMGYLLRDNQTYRKKNAELKAKIPAEGTLVLAGDDAKAWDEYKSLGKAGDLKASLQAALAERDQAKEEAGSLRRAETYKQAAELHGYKASVLADLIERKKLPVEVKDEDVKGKPAKVAYVKDEVNGKPVETKLTEYVEKNWPDYVPSLLAPPPKSPQGTPPRGDANPTPIPRDKPRGLYASGNPFA